MRLFLCLFLCAMTGSQCLGQERFAERAPRPKHPVPHTMERAGYPQNIAPWAIPSNTRYETGGYIGGGSLKPNHILTQGPFTTTGPVFDGTFGWDFAGFKMRPGRVFLAPSADLTRGSMIGRNYRTEAHYPRDIGLYRPLRRALLEKHEVKEEHHAGDH